MSTALPGTSISPSRPWLRFALFLACIPSAGALLLKVYGLMPMREAFLWLAIPSGLVLLYYGIGAGARRNPEIADAVRIGCFGGLLGTIGYDLARYPFYLLGRRLFDPINVYGIWIVDAHASTPYTDAIGWSYHFSNGIAFGIMYALFFRGRAIAWAVLWGLVLETIAIFAPTGPIFGVYGNSPIIVIAYLGHVAYGVPLGYLVREWPDALRWLARVSPLLRRGTIAILPLILLSTIFSSWFPTAAGIDAPAELHIADGRLQPGFLRLDSRDTPVLVVNPTPTAREVVVPRFSMRQLIAAGEQHTLTFPNTGIFQVYAASSGRTRSSLVIVEPVEKRP